MRYIWVAVDSVKEVTCFVMQLQCFSGFLGDNNTPSPGVPEWIVKDFALGADVDNAGAVSKRHSK